MLKNAINYGSQLHFTSICSDVGGGCEAGKDWDKREEIFATFIHSILHFSRGKNSYFMLQFWEGLIRTFIGWLNLKCTLSVRSKGWQRTCDKKGASLGCSHLWNVARGLSPYSWYGLVIEGMSPVASSDSKTCLWHVHQITAHVCDFILASRVVGSPSW